MFKRLTSLVLAALLVLGLLPLAFAEQDLSKQEPVTLKIYTLVNEQPDQQRVFDAVNEYTKAKLNTTVDYRFLGGSFRDKIKVIIASGEEYDACFTSNWNNSYTTNVALGAFVDIKPMLKDYPALYGSMPETFWTATEIKGGIYAVPNQQIAARSPAGLVPTEYLEASGEDITQMYTLKAATPYIQKTFEKFGAKAGGVSSRPDYLGYEMIVDANSAAAIKMDDDSAKVVNLYETPEWLELLNDLHDLNEKGLLDGQVSYMPEYAESQRLAKMLSIFFSGTNKPGGAAEDSLRFGYECVYATNPRAPYMSTNSIIATMYGVSATSKHPDRVLQYLQLINTDPYLMNLLAFGLEGVHYEKVSDTVIRPIAGSGYSHGSSWALGNVFNTFVLETQPVDVWEQTKALNASARPSPVLGFSFDPEPVKMQLASVAKVVKEYESILGGELPVEETNAEFMQKLKVAGVQEIIDEAQRQIDAFKAGK